VTTDRPDEAAIERSRQHRGGVRHACLDLEEALARPATQDTERWLADVATQVRELTEAFRRHMAQSEGPGGLLAEIVEVAPRLAHAVAKVKDEHEVLFCEMERLLSFVAICDPKHADYFNTVRGDALRLLHDVAAHRQRGADLIYDAYSIDVEGGE
jgi:hypothetical protein